MSNNAKLRYWRIALVQWLNSDSRSQEKVARGCMSPQQKVGVAIFATGWLFFLVFLFIGGFAMLTLLNCLCR